MVKKSFLFITTLFASILFLQCASQKLRTNHDQKGSSSGILEIYGQAIYDRENCASCHTLNVQNSTKKLVSLDGVGNKFSSHWLYTYLLEPSMLMPNTKKTDYAHLHSRPFDTLFLNHVSHMYKTGQTDKNLMAKLIDESKPISNELKQIGIKNDQTEILALIAYIKRIPSSPEKLRRDSLQTAEWNRNRALVDSLELASYFEDIDPDDMGTVIQKGQQIFQSNCKACHGEKGQGIVGPNLTDNYFLKGGSRKDITTVIIDGVEGKGMIPWKHALNPSDIRAVSAYVYSLKGTNAPSGKSPQGVKEK